MPGDEPAEDEPVAEKEPAAGEEAVEAKAGLQLLRRTRRYQDSLA